MHELVKRYRHKPELIDAVLWDGSAEALAAVCNLHPRIAVDTAGELVVPMGMGETRAPIGAMVGKFADGSLIVHTGHSFAEHYELVPTPAATPEPGYA